MRDACEHGVEIRTPHVNASQWDTTLDLDDGVRHAVCLSFRQIKDFCEMDAAALAAACGKGFDGVRHQAQAAKLFSETPVKLAEADAFRSLGIDRRQALWAVEGLDGGAKIARVFSAYLGRRTT